MPHKEIRKIPPPASRRPSISLKRTLVPYPHDRSSLRTSVDHINQSKPVLLTNTSTCEIPHVNNFQQSLLLIGATNQPIMNLITALSALSIIVGATASEAADHPSLRHVRSLQDACTQDVKECEDGSFVDRNPANDCEFNPCPEDLPGACQLEVKECEDGSFVNRDPAKDCEFAPCPEEIACAADVRECSDGSFVSRDPANGCAFRPCPEEELACTMDVFDCGNGTFVNRDPAKDCEFEACPKVCTGEDGETYMAACEGIDGMFCVGESFTALDGCNTCSCGNMDGLAACTAMFCPPRRGRGS